MPDICTLISAARTLMACIPAIVCGEPDNGKVFCRPSMSVTLENRVDCNKTILTFMCRRDDGTTYNFTKEE